MLKRQRLSLGIILVYAIVFIFIMSCLLPMINVFAMAFNSSMDNRRGGFILFPRDPTLDNFIEIFTKYPVLRAYGITIFKTVVGIVLSVLVNAAYAYPLTKKNLIAKKFLNWYTMIPMYFGAGLIPYYLMLKNLNLTDTIWVYVIPGVAAPYYIVVFRTFFRSIPDALEESAKLDGAGYLTIFTRIVLPLSMPVIATIALFAGVSQWNDWFGGTVYVFSDKLWPIQTWLRYILNVAHTREVADTMDAASSLATGGGQVAAESLKMSMIVLSVAPILMIYPFMQRYFVAGVMVGSVKE